MTDPSLSELRRELEGLLERYWLGGPEDRLADADNVLAQHLPTLLAALEERDRENERLQNWVNDLQAGMFINCVYCGHRYGPDDEVPATMAEVLKEHVEQCPKHPMSALKSERDEAVAALNKIDQIEKDRLAHGCGYDPEVHEVVTAYLKRRSQ